MARTKASSTTNNYRPPRLPRQGSLHASENILERSLSPRMPANVPSDAFEDPWLNSGSSAGRSQSNGRRRSSNRRRAASPSLRSSSSTRLRSRSTTPPRQTNPFAESGGSPAGCNSSSRDGNESWMRAPIRMDDGLASAVLRPPNTASSPPTPPPLDSEERRVSSSTTTNPEREGSSSSGSTSTRSSDEALGGQGGGEDTSMSSSRRRKKSFSNLRRSEGSLMEKLFGDAVPPSRRIFRASSPIPNTLPPIHNRTPLSTNVFHNPATDFWIATVNLHQKEGRQMAAKHLRAFSYGSQLEAEKAAEAYAPPKMLPFGENSNCFLCRGKFALFRRAKHCRNCGVCVCSSCSQTWSRKMIPETFNIKNEKQVTVCRSCHWLSDTFMHALMSGNYQEVMVLYHTGNLNLRCPFSLCNGEQMFPIHCAAQGGNLQLLTWLIDEQNCPIRLTRTGNNNQTIENPLLTSRSRSVLHIAMEFNHIPLIRYLVVEKQMSLYHLPKDVKLVLNTLDAVVRALPADMSHVPPTAVSSPSDTREMLHLPQQHPQSPGLASTTEDEDDDDVTVTSIADACILCYEKSIDCVITPCGHQICCMDCSVSLSHCPVCFSQGTFIKIYRP